ncbi:MAG: hypothetical protein WB566_17460 [Terriglobales bacterium]
MWPRGALFFFSFLLVPLLARKYWNQYRVDQSPISRLRMSGVL